jgi:hypothetical protein
MHHGSNRANPSALHPFHFSSNLVRHQVLTMPEPLISWTVLHLSPFSIQPGAAKIFHVSPEGTEKY